MLFPATGLLQNFAHVTTAQLSWHVQNFVVTTLLQFAPEQNKFSAEFYFEWKSISGMDPLAHSMKSLSL